jgi:hypothetical protein
MKELRGDDTEGLLGSERPPLYCVRKLNFFVERETPFPGRLKTWLANAILY